MPRSLAGLESRGWSGGNYAKSLHVVVARAPDARTATLVCSSPRSQSLVEKRCRKLFEGVSLASR